MICSSLVLSPYLAAHSDAHGLAMQDRPDRLCLFYFAVGFGSSTSLPRFASLRFINIPDSPFVEVMMIPPTQGSF